MLSLSRRFFFSALFLGTCVLAGCGDMGTLAYFLTPEQPVEAKIKHLASDNPKKEPRVLIIAYGGCETRRECQHADRTLCEILTKQLKALAQTNKERISFVSPGKVEEYKNNNPNWRSSSLVELGRKLAADYVIYLDINSLSLFEPNSMNQMLRGVANVSVQLHDVRNPDESPNTQTIICRYPDDLHGPESVSADLQVFQFRQIFLDQVATKLAHCFSRYPRNERHRMGGFRNHATDD